MKKWDVASLQSSQFCQFYFFVHLGTVFSVRFSQFVDPVPQLAQIKHVWLY